MTDPVPVVAPPGSPWPPRPQTPTPGTVTAAAIVTIVVSTMTIGAVLLMTVVIAVIGPALASAFDDMAPLAAVVLGLAVIAVGTSALSIVASVKLLRRRRWAWWTLLALSLVRALMGFGGGTPGLSMLSSAAALAVFVLLLLPSTREWLAAEG